MCTHYPWFYVWGQMWPFNYPTVAFISSSSCPWDLAKRRKGRREENVFHLSRTKLIIQLLFSKWLCCPDNFRAIYNRLSCQDNKRRGCHIITSRGEGSTQNSWDCQNLLSLQRIHQHILLFLSGKEGEKKADDKVMSQNTLNKMIPRTWVKDRPEAI